jgi:hypothetical protein
MVRRQAPRPDPPLRERAHRASRAALPSARSIDIPLTRPTAYHMAQTRVMVAVLNLDAEDVTLTLFDTLFQNVRCVRILCCAARVYV